MRAFEHGDGSWWYFNTGLSSPLPDHDDTRSWRVADELPRHLWQYGLVHIDPVQQPWGWTRGDILAEDWYGENGKGAFNHLQFVVGTTNSGNSREPLIAIGSGQGHNYPHKAWQIVRKRIEEEEGGAGWTRAALAIKHTNANLQEKQHAPENLYGPIGLFNG